MEQAEFEHIATSVRQRAFATALAFTGDRDESEDIAQETMLKLWTLRSRINSLSLDGDRNVIDNNTVSPDRAIEDKETLAWLENCLAALPSTEYQILWLRQVERKSHDEIARIVGVRKTSIPTILSRARLKMLNEFKKRTR